MSDKKVKALEKKSKVGWAKYYKSEQASHILMTHHMEKMKEMEEKMKEQNIYNNDIWNIPEFVKNEMKDMIKELKKEIECPICLTELKSDEIKFSSCGHKYCASCLAKIDECAICRKKIYHKKI